MPSSIHRLWLKLRSWLAAHAVEREIDEELEFHLEMRTGEYMRRGTPRAEARRRALERFGSVQRHRRSVRAAHRIQDGDTRRGAMMDDLINDLRFGARMLVRRPAVSLVAITTLALGIGASTAIFTLIDGILLEPLPYEAPGELVMVWEDHSRRGGPDREWASPNNFLDWRDETRTFERMAALGGWGPTLTGAGEPTQLIGATVSHDTFEMLGVSPVLGRGFQPDEEGPGAERVVVLSHPLWQQRFGGDESVVGGTVDLSGTPWEVVGVLPPDFALPVLGELQIYRPLPIDRSNACGRGCVTLRVVGRLAADADLEAARAEMAGLMARFEEEYPEALTGVGINLVPLHEQVVGPVRPALLVLLAAVGAVLLIACANVANLMLARASGRRREVAVRMAMGAGRSRLVRQLLTESLMLAALGAAGGAALARWSVDAVVRTIPDGAVPRLAGAGVDVRALLFTAGLAVLTGILFGMVPAWRVSSPRIGTALQEGGRGADAGGQSLRKGLVVVEVGLAVALLVGAGLLVRSFTTLVRVDPGFHTDGVLYANLALSGDRYDATARRAFHDELLARVRALPGVEAAGHTSSLPLTGFDGDTGFMIEGREPPPPGTSQALWYRSVSPGYFSTMDVSIVAGRAFGERDHAEAPPVVIINEAAARRFWPDEDPVGQRISVNDPQRWREIVGIAEDTKHFGLDAETRPAMYLPISQLPSGFFTLVVQAAVPPEALAGSIRAIVADLDPQLAAPTVGSFAEIVDGDVAAPRLTSVLLGIFAGVAVLLAAVGLYGVMSYAVTERRREIGVRMALGARGGDVLRLVVGQGMLLIGIGALGGWVAALALSRGLESLLYGVDARDPLTFAVVPLVIVAVGLLSAWLPARRAAAVDPGVALRQE